MRYSRLGRTQLQVSTIGFGCWGIGGTSWIGAQADTSLRALKEARDLGINFFDTALVYGHGHSECLLAQAFGCSKDVVIATKVPPKNRKWPAPAGVPLSEAFPKQHVQECLRRSLQNLKREYVDLLQYHVWSDEWADDPEWLETVMGLQRSGLVRFVGISINDHQPENGLRALRTGLIDCVQVIYNIFDQSAQDNLFPYCMQHDIGVIARAPFDEGSLAARIRPETVFPDGDFRNYYFAGNRKATVWERVQEITRDMGIDVEELPQLALEFCLSHRAVSSAVPGMRTVEHVRGNAAAGSGELLSDEAIKILQRHRWARNFYSPSPTMVARLIQAVGRFGVPSRNKLLSPIQTKHNLL
jgi:aryl-alcohol dehydrogenase-like predicted oxidoreductase